VFCVCLSSDWLVGRGCILLGAALLPRGMYGAALYEALIVVTSRLALLYFKAVGSTKAHTGPPFKLLCMCCFVPTVAYTSIS
jgi:hypothetical protein